jgi:hypothetical protein
VISKTFVKKLQMGKEWSWGRNFRLKLITIGRAVAWCEAVDSAVGWVGGCILGLLHTLVIINLKLNAVQDARASTRFAAHTGLLTSTRVINATESESAVFLLAGVGKTAFYSPFWSKFPHQQHAVLRVAVQSLQHNLSCCSNNNNNNNNNKSESALCGNHSWWHHGQWIPCQQDRQHASMSTCGAGPNAQPVRQNRHMTLQQVVMSVDLMLRKCT